MILAEHPKGQYLAVSGGVGLTQEWGQPAQRIQPGDKTRDGPAAYTPEEVLKLAHNCSSGAIHCQHPDGTAMGD